MVTPKIVEISDGIYWVGGSGQDGGLHCNPYLIVDEDEAVLIDPGNVLDFEYVYENVLSIVPLEKIKYVILHHQDPDFCSSVPLFEQKGGKFKIVTHWRTQTLVKYYGIKSDYYIVNENDFRLVLNSGRTLGFVQTPYLHFPGAITTYDYNSKVLFSSDLFGAFSYEWSIYANDDYIEKMKTFHEHYMPSNDIIRPVMEVFLGMDISIIAPQHGSIIINDIRKYIIVLRDLECGFFIDPIKKDLTNSGGYKTICTKVLKRYESVFNKEEVLEALDGMKIVIDDGLEITDYNYLGNELWNLIFERVLAKKGIEWILVIEPLVQKLSKEYDIAIPKVFEANLTKAEQKVLNISKENAALQEININLVTNLKKTEEKLIKCPITGLYNYDFFKNYIFRDINNSFFSEYYPALIIVSLDNMEKIRYSYGDNEVNDVLKNVVYILEDIKQENEVLFKLQSDAFACYFPQLSKNKAVEIAENIRNKISSSEKFIEKTTASIGVVCLKEIREKGAYVNEPDELMYNIAMMRTAIAKKMGMNIVCSNSSVSDYQDEIGNILLVDTDEINIDVIKIFLENFNYKIIVAKDGMEAVRLIEQYHVDLIISEIMLPKMDGFLLREKLLSQSNLKNVPFIIVSYLKDDVSVKRSASLGIEHYFKKPYMLSELYGVIKNKLKKSYAYEH